MNSGEIQTRPRPFQPVRGGAKHPEIVQRLMLAALVLGMLGALTYCYEYQLDAQMFRRDAAQANWLSMTSTCLFAVIPCLWLPLHYRRPSDLVVSVIYIFVYCSSVLALSYSWHEGSVTYMVMLCVCMFVLNLCLRAYQGGQLKVQPVDGRYFIFFLVGMIGLFALLVYQQLGFQRTWIDLSEVYSIRDGSDISTTGEYAPWLDVTMRWLGFALLPVAISIGVFCRLHWLWLGCCVLYYYLYVTTGHKTYFFAGFVVFGLSHASWLLRGLFAHRLIALTIGFTALVAALKVLFAEPMLLDLWVRRCFIVPGHLTNLYHEYFSTNPKFEFSTSGFLGLFNFNGRLYQLEIPNLIGLTYFGSERMSANTNIWADAYANHGYVLMLIVSVLLAIVLRFIDLAARGLSVRLVAPVLIMPAVTIINSSLIPVLVGHGLLFVYFLLLLMPRSPQFMEKHWSLRKFLDE
jgi:hypothetical protein